MRICSFLSNAPISLVAAAGETGNGITTWEFLAQGKSLGIVTNEPAWPWPDFSLPPCGTNIAWRPFSFLWTNAPVGSNSVTALATDNNGTQVLSAPVTINVLTNSYLTAIGGKRHFDFHTPGKLELPLIIPVA